MKEQNKLPETLQIAIEAVRHAQLCMFNLENETRVNFIHWNVETYNALDLMEAWMKAFENKED